MKAQVVSFHCVLKNKLGQILSTSINNEVLTIPGEPGLFLQGLHEGLLNIKKGEKRKIFIPADRAYGYYKLEKIKRLALDKIGEVKVGESVCLGQEPAPYRVISIENDFVILDGNHPLAGQDLIFEVEATSVRNAKPEELADEVATPLAEVFH